MSIVTVLLFASTVITSFVILSIFLKEKSENLKRVLFLGIVLPAVSATIYLAVSTIKLNVSSVTKGPVHWHADFEIWDCGNKVDLIDPKGLSNKVGTPVLHEHNDNRIHVEGVVVDYKDVSLGRFFEVVGGKITQDELVVPINSGMVQRKRGDYCSDGTLGVLQVFAYRTEGKYFSQQKITEPASFVLASYSRVPPGDCIIIEFGPKKDRTDKLCNFYKIAAQKGELNER